SAREPMASLIAHNEPAPLEGLEACDQTHVGLFTPDLIPWKPETIGNTELRLALVFDELLRWKDITPRRAMVGWHTFVFIERVDNQLTFHTNRIGSLAIVEEQPPAKPSFGANVGIMPYRFGPGPDQSIGNGLARFFLA